MQNADRKKIIQQGFDTIAEGYDHPALSFFPETAKRLVEHLQLNPTDHLLDVCTVTYCRGEKSVVSTLFTFHYPFFIVFSWWDVVWNAGWRTFLNQMSEQEQESFKVEHLQEISDVLGSDGVWFNTEVLVAVGEKQ